MKRIALMSIVAAAAAMFGLINPTSAETTVPMEELALVSEVSPSAQPAAPGLDPVQYPRFQYPTPRFQYPSPRFQYPSPRFQYPSPRFQYPSPRFQAPRFQYPHPHRDF